MNRIILTLLFIFGLISRGKCDTITNWQIYHNNDLIEALNINSQHFTFKLKKSDLTKNDTVFLRVNGCIVNSVENISILVIDDKMEKSIELNDRNTYFTLDKIKRTKSKLFDVFYYPEKKKLGNKILLFKIEIN